jgi:hypothetical protein
VQDFTPIITARTKELKPASLANMFNILSILATDQTAVEKYRERKAHYFAMKHQLLLRSQPTTEHKELAEEQETPIFNSDTMETLELYHRQLLEDLKNGSAVIR